MKPDIRDYEISSHRWIEPAPLPKEKAELLAKAETEADRAFSERLRNYLHRTQP